MDKLQVKARAKINLTLDVLGKRSDGYHEIETIMQTIELHDVVTVEEAKSGIDVTTDHPLLPGGESNIAFRAARLMIDSFGPEKGIRIRIKKNIPLAAGLAGGSSNAAAVMIAINRLWKLGLSRGELLDKGALIGSDVPFCIMGGTALARGRGEFIDSLPDAPEFWVVVAKPNMEVSTAEVYRNFQSEKVTRRPDTRGMVNALLSGDLKKITGNLVNVLESVTIERYPAVLQVKQAMQKSGLQNPLMSGSGPSVFAVAEDRDTAEKAAGRLKTLIPDMFVKVSRMWPAEREEFRQKT